VEESEARHEERGERTPRRRLARLRSDAEARRMMREFETTSEGSFPLKTGAPGLLSPALAQWRRVRLKRAGSERARDPREAGRFERIVRALKRGVRVGEDEE